MCFIFYIFQGVISLIMFCLVDFVLINFYLSVAILFVFILGVLTILTCAKTIGIFFHYFTKLKIFLNDVFGLKFNIIVQ
jgi:hypothetical protein